MAKKAFNKTTKTTKGKSISKKSYFRADTKQTQALARASRAGAANAIRTSKALGLTITYLKDNSLIREDAQGNITVKVNKQASDTKIKKATLKKGMVFYAKK